MSEWKEISLGQLSLSKQIEIKTGPFGSQLHQSDYVCDGVPVVMPKDIIEWKISLDSIARTSKQMVEKLSIHMLKQGDIVYGRRGDIGRHALISEKEENWLCGTGCIRIRLRRGVPFTPRFLSMFLRLPSTIESIYNQAVGATMPNLNTSIIENIKVVYPSRKEQEKITEILFAYDKLIENNNSRIAKFEEMAKRLYREWFVHFRFPGHENVNMIDSELGIIPEGWKVYNLFDCTDVQYGYPFKSRAFTNDDSLSPVIRIRDILGNETRTYSPEKPDDKYVVLDGDILIGMDGIFHMNQWAGGRSYLNQRVVRLRPKNISGFHLYYHLEPIIKYLEDTITGTTVAHLSDADLKKVFVLIADDRTQQMANKLLQPLLDEKITLLHKNQNLRRTRDLLLPRLISGDIDVSSIDIPISEEMD